VALSIKDEQADRLVRRYAKLHNTTYTGAIIETFTNALRSEGLLEPDGPGESDFIALVRDVQRKVAALPTLDDRPADDILYDEDGLPK